MAIRSLFLFLFVLKSYSCELKPKKSIYSLSSPVTLLLEELELLNSNSISAISIFHPVKAFSGKRLAGGVFLTEKAFDDKEESIVIFDESKDLKRNLSKLKKTKTVEVVSRGLDAFGAYEYSKKILSPYLVNCSTKIKRLDKRVSNIKEKLRKIKKKSIVFYLNHFNSNLKRPNLIIVNDGFVKSLIEIAKIKTYPSSLGYVNWSAKIIKNLSKNFIHIGVDESKSDLLYFKKLKKNYFNTSFRGALSPGIRQVIFIEKLISKLL